MTTYERFLVTDEQGIQTKCQTLDIAHHFIANHPTSKLFTIHKVTESHTLVGVYGFAGTPIPAVPEISQTIKKDTIDHYHFDV